MTLKLCKDCQHYYRGILSILGGCHREREPVRGKIVPNYCWNERRLGSCGPEGKHWEPKR